VVSDEARDALEQFAKLTPPAGRERIEARLRRDGEPGDLLVTVEVQVPSGAVVSDEARDALEQFAKLTPPAGRERIEARMRRGK
jgi:molecular chaperone DnaJ